MMDKKERLNSAIYVGDVQHRRMSPKWHAFKYRLFMMYLDVGELSQVLALSPFWSARRFALARFRREDFHGDPALPIDVAIKKTVEEKLGFSPDGPVRMLANWRYFGINMNPLVTYYCFNASGQVEAVVAEVNNTPWNERHAYVLPADPEKHALDVSFDKCFSVSPFHPLDLQYAWKSNTPGNTLAIHIDTLLNNKCVFDATLSLKRVPLSGGALAKILFSYPFMTVKVVAAIYWQALKIWLKGVPFLGKDKHINIVGSSGS